MIRPLPSLASLTALLLAACQGTPTPAQVAADAAALAHGVGEIAQNLASLHDLSPALAATIETASGDAAAAAQALATAETANATKTLALRLTGDVSAVVSALAALPDLPKPVSEVLMAAEVLLPVFETEAGLTPPAAAAPGEMSPEAARRILEGGHG
jgi:hypothetical protein